jgi:hypothetical protein
MVLDKTIIGIYTRYLSRYYTLYISKYKYYYISVNTYLSRARENASGFRSRKGMPEPLEPTCPNVPGGLPR